MRSVEEILTTHGICCVCSAQEDDDYDHGHTPDCELQPIIAAIVDARNEGIKARVRDQIAIDTETVRHAAQREAWESGRAAALQVASDLWDDFVLAIESLRPPEPR